MRYLPFLVLIVIVGGFVFELPVIAEKKADVHFVEKTVVLRGERIGMEIATLSDESPAFPGVVVESDEFALTGAKYTIDFPTWRENPAGGSMTPAEMDAYFDVIDWNRLAPTDLSLQFDPNPTTLPASICEGQGSDGQQVVSFGNLGNGVIGVACWNFNNECDLVLSSSYQGDFRPIILHEIGHCVGLAHSNDPNAIMYPVYHGQQGINQDDRAGFCSIYACDGATPSATATVSATVPRETPVPTFTATATIPPTNTTTATIPPATATFTRTATNPPATATSTPKPKPTPTKPKWLLRSGKNVTPAVYAATYSPCVPNAIFGFDEDEQEFKIWSPNVPDFVNDLRFMNAERGYWIYCP